MSDEPQTGYGISRARFDPTINLGHLLTMAALIGTVIVGGATLSTRIALIEAQMGRMAELLDRSIRLDEQVRAFNSRIDRLERLKD